MDPGFGTTASSIEVMDKNVSFMDLINMVSNHAVMKNPRYITNISNNGGVVTESDTIDTIDEQLGVQLSEGFFFGSELPTESIGTCVFDTSVTEAVSGSLSESQSINTGTRSYSSFTKLYEDCAGSDVTSQPKECSGGPIEESMRKYCEDRERVMFKPEVGMEFCSAEEAYQFYNMYSWVSGFSIRYGDNYTNKKKERTMQEYMCQREGKDRDTKYSTTRCGCKAMMRVSISENSKWYLKKFVADHNHAMVESCGEKKHLASHRQIDKHTKEIIRHLRENNVSLTRVNLVMGSLFGSMDNVPFSKKTLKTVCSNIAKEAMEDDVRKTLESFREKIVLEMCPRGNNNSVIIIFPCS